MVSLITAIALLGGVTAAQDTTQLVHYDIQARFQAESSVVAARVRISVPAAVRGRDTRLELRLPVRGSGATRGPRLDLQRVTDASGRPMPVNRNPDGTRVFVSPAAKAGPLELVAEYRIPVDTSDLSQLGYFLFTSESPDNAWYPTVAGLEGPAARFADFDVSIEAPAEYAVLTSGALLSTAAPAGEAGQRYRARFAEGFALALGPGFRLLTVETEGVRVTAFAPPADSALFAGVVRETAAAAGWYKRAYGFFPTPHIGIVPGVTWASGGWPLPNVFMIHRGNLSASFVRFITAHELGHYYWGLWVLDPEERLGWLVLANGIWADQYQLAQRESTTVEWQWRRSGGGWLRNFVTAQVGNYEQRLGITSEEEETLGFDYNTLVRHGKAAMLLYLISRRLGWERFLAVQRDILRDYAHRPLPLDEFITRVADAGYPETKELVTAWARGDARLGYQISRIEPDSTGYWVVLERTGTIPYPVDVEVRGAGGAVQRLTFTGVADVDSQRVRATAPPDDVRLDPDGVLPMWDSDSPEIRRLFIRALYSAALDGPFLALAPGFLEQHPDPEIRALLVYRLFDLARYAQVVAAGRAPGDSLTCDTRLTCRAAILVARSLIRTGDVAGASRLLDQLKPLAPPNSSQRQWDQAAAELEAARH